MNLEKISDDQVSYPRLSPRPSSNIEKGIQHSKLEINIQFLKNPLVLWLCFLSKIEEFEW